jgi:hypothetical protein
MNSYQDDQDATKGTIIVGTTPQQFLKEGPPGPTLALDTDRAVFGLAGEAKPYHLVVDPRTPPPDHVPSAVSPNAGEAGAAWDPSFALWAFVQAEDRGTKLMSWLREMVVTPNIDLIDVLPSAFGGTGNGCFPRLRQWLARRTGQTRVVFTHWIQLGAGSDEVTMPELANQLIRIRDLFSRAEPQPAHRHVISGTARHVPEIRRMTRTDWDDADGVLTNLWEKARSSRRTILLRRLEVPIETLVDEVLKQILAEIPRRLREGRPLQSGEQKLVERRLVELREFFGEDIDVPPARSLPSDTVATKRQHGNPSQGTPEQGDSQHSDPQHGAPQQGDPRHLVQVIEERAEAHAEPLLRNWEEQLFDVVAECGIEPVRSDLSNLQGSLKKLQEAQKDQLAQGLQALSQARADVAGAPEGGSWSLLSRLWSPGKRTNGHAHQHANGVNGSSSAHDRACTEYEKASTKMVMLERATRLVGQLLRGEGALHKSTHVDLTYSLPSGALKQELVDRGLRLRLQANMRTVRNELRECVEQRIEDVVREALRHRLPQQMAFDFDVTQETYTGAVVVSPFRSEVAGDLVRPLNPDMHQVKQRATSSLRIFRVATVDRLDQIPTFTQAFRRLVREDTVQARRPREAVDIHPMRLRDGNGVWGDDGTPDLEYAAQIVLMAYFAPRQLVIDDAGVELPSPAGDTIRYPSIEALARGVTVATERRIRRAFWNDWFARNRRGAMRRVDRLAQGQQYAKDKKYDRFKRLTLFLDSKQRIQDALQELARQVRTAGQHWM